MEPVLSRQSATCVVEMRFRLIFWMICSRIELMKIPSTFGSVVDSIPLILPSPPAYPVAEYPTSSWAGGERRSSAVDNVRPVRPNADLYYETIGSIVELDRQIPLDLFRAGNGLG